MTRVRWIGLLLLISVSLCSASRALYSASDAGPREADDRSMSATVATPSIQRLRTLQGERDGDGDRATERGEAGGDAAASPALAAQTASSSLASGCNITIDGQPKSYAACSSLPVNFNGGYLFYWTLETVAGKTMLHGAFQGTASYGYVGWGIPSESGRMIGADAVVVQTDDASTTGAKADDYYLGGYETADCPSPSRMTLSGPITSSRQGGELVSAFTVSLTAAEVAKLAAFDIIYVIGPLNGDGTLGSHAKSFGMGATIDLTAGGGKAAVSNVSSGGLPPAVHGWISAIAIGIFMPLTMIIARNFKEYNPMWFHLHRIVGSLAFVGAIAGGALGFQLVQGGGLVLLHEIFGVAVMLLALVQVSAILLRPNPGHKLRSIWEHGHHFAGRAAVALAISNVYIGLTLADESVTFYAVYSAILGALVLVWFSKEITDCVKARKAPAKDVEQFIQPGASSSGADGLQMQQLRD